MMSTIKMVKEIGLYLLKDIPQSYRQKKTLLKEEDLYLGTDNMVDLLSRDVNWVQSFYFYLCCSSALITTPIVGTPFGAIGGHGGKVDAGWLATLFGPYPHRFSLLSITLALAKVLAGFAAVGTQRDVGWKWLSCKCGQPQSRKCTRKLPSILGL
jgi:hypothetical protein